MYAVWQPMLPTDWAAPTTAVLSRLSDARVRQYWDREHVLAKRMAHDAKAPQPKQNCCVRNELLWDLAAVYPKGVRWGDGLPPATLFDGPVVDVIPALETSLSPHR